MYRDSHYNDETVMRPSYIPNENVYNWNINARIKYPIVNKIEQIWPFLKVSDLFQSPYGWILIPYLTKQPSILNPPWCYVCNHQSHSSAT